ncbi:phosphatase PAP2 family protein [Variovorax saccharolyticus]|uniref:phosphatase PAP2 family protein n=1 Tax=Variovorax saccharolyticus TaxID=3053516 RepID=UPI002574ED8C|nr:phosphatase PAP2 family protein [Variovorax sp. J31P216]MDM0029664.1 phosphatase PAP2 family protein [Variovorax sp. J31P216]
MEAEAAPLVSAAQLLGQHALAVFAIGLLVAMAASGLGCALLHRRHARRIDAGDAIAPTLARLLAGYAIGFALILGTASLVAVIGQQISSGRHWGLADQALADAMGRHTPAVALRAFGVLTHLGDPLMLAVLGAAVAVLLWLRRERLLSAGWIIALAGNAILNPLLKQVFERVRPLHDLGTTPIAGYSFPSGHTSGAMVAYGMLLYLAIRLLPLRWHAAVAMAAVALVLTIACSRVFLRVHFASDVAAGLLSGLSWLGVCVASLQFASHRRTAQPNAH